jgi:hypothetical protein
VHKLKKLGSKIIWAGIGANFLFVIPLFFAPEWLLGLLHIQLDRVIWAQFAAVLLFIISVFYIPAAIDIDRFRINAWFHCIPSRASGAIFFAVNILFLGAEPGFWVAVVVDAVFGLLLLWVLLRISRLEKQGAFISE